VTSTRVAWLARIVLSATVVAWTPATSVAAPAQPAHVTAAALRSPDPNVRLRAALDAVVEPLTDDVKGQLERMAADPADPLRDVAFLAVAQQDDAYASAHVDDVVRLVGIKLEWTTFDPGSGAVSNTHDLSAIPITLAGKLGPMAGGALPVLRRLEADADGWNAVSVRIAIARIEGRPLQPLVDAAVVELSHRDRHRREAAVITIANLWPETRSAPGALERLQALEPLGEPWDTVVRRLIEQIAAESGSGGRR